MVARQRVYHQRRHSLSLGDTGTDHPSVPATIFKVCGSRARYAVTCRFVFDLSFWPLLRLKTSRLLGGSLDLSGFGFLRLACGTAISSVCISISVCVCVSTPGQRVLNQLRQGVAAGTRVCQQRRHSRFPGDTGTHHPSVPAVIASRDSNFPRFVSMVHDTSHKPFPFRIAAADFLLSAFGNIFNNTVCADSCALPFHHLPSQRGN